MPSAPRVSSITALALALSGVVSCHRGEPAPPPALHVAAAADLAFAFHDVGAAYEAKTGTKVTFSFGSTGLLAKQIAEGAPFDVFAAANTSFVDDVVRAGACDSSTTSLYATGRLVAWSKSDAPFHPTTLEDLARPEVVHVSIANPEHAPYGRAAKEALAHAAAWKTIEPKLVFGENVQQALQFAQSGNAEVAVVALSLAVATPGAALPIDPALHGPLQQAMVVCRGAVGATADQKARARTFVDFVGSPEGRAVMRRYGFLLPGETLTDAR